MAADGGYASKNGGIRGQLQRDEFPILCETCLGDNPYVRMVKLPYGQKLCKISKVPYQAFRWKAGNQGRYKETIISQDVAAHRNICQTCLNDLKFGLPVGVRDSMLQQEDSQRIKMPASDVGSQYFYAQIANDSQATSDGSNFALNVANIGASNQLTAFSQSMYRPKSIVETASTASSSSSPWQTTEGSFKGTAFRNLPKLCSFWLNGTCNRVLRNTCPFRPCCGCFVFPEIASSDKETCDKLVQDLKDMGPAVVMKKLDSTVRNAIHNALKGNRDESIRKRVSGEDDLTKKYLDKIKSSNAELEPPADISIRTLWLGNLDYSTLTREHLYGMIYSYGRITNLQCVNSGNFAFVEFATREEAEYAAKNMYNNLYIGSRRVAVNWAKPKAQGTVVGSSSATEMPMPAPPGLETSSAEQYSLPNIPAPMIPPPPAEPRPAHLNNETGAKRKLESSDNVDSDTSTSFVAKKLPQSSLYPSMDANRLGSSV